MLVDVEFKKPEERMEVILGFITGGRDIIPTRIGQGLYLATHWSLENLVGKEKLIDRWAVHQEAFDKARATKVPFNFEKEFPFPDYGVCDTPEQLIEKYPALQSDPNHYFVSFVEITRDNQPSQGGWRWHKWGEYIGDQEPEREYIHDEPNIERVYTFSVYQLAVEPSTV